MHHRVIVEVGHSYDEGERNPSNVVTSQPLIQTFGAQNFLLDNPVALEDQRPKQTQRGNMKLSLDDKPNTATVIPLKLEDPPAQAHHSLEIENAEDEDLS
jgi:uncharacterized protein YccT (UPF0319 family)